MPTTTQRLDHMAALVTLLQAIDGTGDYTSDLSGAGAASDGFETADMLLTTMQELGISLVARVEEGAQGIQYPEINSPLAQDAWEVVVRLVATGDPAEAMDTVRKRLNKGLGDVSLALGRDPRVGNSVNACRIVRVDSPEYSPDQRLGAMALRCASEWTHTSGVTT